MPDGVLDCGEVRLRLESYLDGADASPALAAHLAACEACLEACLEAALRRPEEVRAPAGFVARTVARTPLVDPEPPTVLPYTLAAACVLWAVFGTTAVFAGIPAEVGRWIERLFNVPATVRTSLLLSLVGLETAASLLWFWRASRA